MGVLTGRFERRQFAPEPVIPPYLGAPTTNSQTLTKPEQALQVPAVWACVQLLAGAVSMMPLRTFRAAGPGAGAVPTPITDPQIVTTPSDGMTQSEWLHMLMVSLLLRGNAYGLMDVSQYAATRATQVALLNPDFVQVQTDPATGMVRYLVGPNRQDLTDRIWHVRGLTLPGQKVGLSPIAAAAQAIGTDLSARKFAKDFFDGGGVPKATLTSSEDLTMEQAATAKERLRAATLNREPAVFGSGITYNPISVKPEESQFLETQQAGVAEIARYFGIPAEMVGGKAGSSLTYSNVEQRSLDFLTYGVAFWLRRIEDSFSLSLLPQPQYVQFDTGALLRTDADTQAKVRATYVAAKVLPPSRILTAMGEPALTQDEKTELELVPLTVTPTGMPKALPNPGTPLTSDDTPEVGPQPATPPRLGVVNSG